jgi:DNA-binding NarL/FixJ family response regulator
MSARILLVIPDVLAREMLIGYLRGLSAGYSVSAVSDGRSALDLLRNFPADAVVLDSELPDIDALPLARRISTEYSHAKILFRLQDSRYSSILDALDSGAVGFLLGERLETEIGPALRTVFSGKISISPVITRGTPTQAFLKELRRSRFLKMFTPMEHAVLQCIREAMTNRKIAETLHMSVSTVKSHKSNIMDKMGIRNSPEILKISG